MVMEQCAGINGKHALKTVLKHHGVILVNYRLYQQKKNGFLYTRYNAFTHVILASYAVVYTCMCLVLSIKINHSGFVHMLGYFVQEAV